jgi:GH15 family glucan-1,4-alpha-glucosidase
MDLEFILRFDYGASVPWVKRLPGGDGIQAVAGPDLAVLRSPVPLEGKDLTTVAHFEVGAGERIPFVLAHGASHLALPQGIDAEAALADSEKFWQAWCSRCNVGGEWQGIVRRSLITLKALTYAPTGGVVAAPTTSLPEQPDGGAQLGLPVLLVARRDADAARADGRRILRRGGRVARLAGARGRRLAVADADHVRHRGRAAHAGMDDRLAAGLRRRSAGARRQSGASQFQLDVYGEVMDALHQARKQGIAHEDSAWDLQRAL